MISCTGAHTKRRLLRAICSNAREIASAGEARIHHHDGHKFWSVDKQTLRLVRDPGDQPARKAEERCNYSLNGRILMGSDCRFAGRYVRGG
jgi:hypothetical protein